MDILTLELLDVTVSQALAEARRALEQHPGMALRLVLGSDELVRHNLTRFLEREGHGTNLSRAGALWQLDVQPKAAPAAAPPLTGSVPAAEAPPRAMPLPLKVPEAPRPLLLLHGGFPGGDLHQGRRLLLEVLGRIAPPTPCLVLAHGAMDLLAEPHSRNALQAIQDRGVPVRLSREGLLFLGEGGEGFEEIADAEWQGLLARGAAALL